MMQIDLSKRTPDEVFAHHARANEAEDLDALMMDYAANAIFIRPAGVLRGKDAIRRFFADFHRALPKRRFGVKAIYADNVLFIEWTADSPQVTVSDGVDNFLFEDGLIKVQTTRYTIVHKV